MSYSTKEALGEQQNAIYEALNSENPYEITQMAKILKAQGEDEEAERLLNVARSISRGEWAYDEANGN